METLPAEEKPLTGPQIKAIAHLAAGNTIEAAAKEAKVSAVTLHTWLKKEPFLSEYKSATRAVIEHASSQLKAATGKAVNTLCEVAEDSTAPASSRVSAARAIMELAYRSVELDEQAQRIEALEAAMEAQGGNGRK